MPAVGNSALFWLLLGWTGFAILPWYFDDGLLSVPAASGLVLAIADRRFWLLPLGLPLLLGFVPMMRPHSRAAAAGWLIAIGLAGLVWVGLEGFAIDHRGWSAKWIGDLFGTVGPRQGGVGYGAFLTLLAFLMLLCRGLAARGISGGDAFTASALGLILAMVGLFVFFPVSPRCSRARSRTMPGVLLR
jgi:iron(III) transport system permease protein